MEKKYNKEESVIIFTKKENDLKNAKDKYYRLVSKIIGNVRCPEHNEVPEIIIEENSIKGISHVINGCCPKLVELAINKIKRYNSIKDETDFLEKIKEADDELSQLNIPIYQRPIRVLPIISPCDQTIIFGLTIDKKNFPEYSGPNLMDHIDKWYKELYGDRVFLPKGIGKIPLLFKNEIFIARVPLVYGKVEIYFLNLLKALPRR